MNQFLVRYIKAASNEEDIFEPSSSDDDDEEDNKNKGDENDDEKKVTKSLKVKTGNKEKIPKHKWKSNKVK